MTTLPAWIGWLLLALPCGTAPVCKCAMPTVEDQFAQAEMVFSGTVLRAGSWVRPHTAPPEPARQDSGGIWIVSAGQGTGMLDQPVTLAVTRAWKGAADADMVTVGNLYLCGVAFEPGAEYLVYAVAEADGRPVTSFCQRSRPFSSPARDGRRDELLVLDSLAARGRP